MHTFQIDGLSSELRVMRFEGHEALSQLYHFDVVVACTENDIAFADAVGKPAVLSFRVGDDPRHVHGIVSSFEQGEEGKKLTAYHLTLVPNVWRLQHRRDSRIFQAMSTPDILKKVFAKDGVNDVKYRLSGSYSPREYCVQYRESDWAFVCRLMEEEGIYYYFEHTEAKDVLVVGDGPDAHDPIAGESTLPFRPPSGALVKSEHVSRFRVSERVRPGKVTLRDYNFQKPSLSLEASKAGSIDTDLEIYDYPGDYDAPGAGSSIAKSRLEMLQATKKTGDGQSACPRFTPGYKFKLTDHARDDFNAEYLITRVDHQGFEPGLDAPMGDSTAPYQNQFEVMPADVPFRAPQVTPWPTIKGIQTAIVVGPGGDEIYTDAHGRIKVQFHWDREGKKDEHSSCWMRVSQIWAGGAWGAVFIPRIGHEVVVDFLEGDPDRPLVVGSVYHGANVPPYALPGEKTKSTVKSNSSLGGGGFNELRFEDKKGSEEIFLHGEKDWNIVIKHDKNQLIGHDETLEVDHDRTKLVKNDQSETVQGNKKIHVSKNHTEKIDQDESMSVGGNRTVNVSGNHTESVDGNQTASVGGNLDMSVGGGMSLAVSASHSVTVNAASSESVAKNKETKVGENYAIEVSKDMSVTVTKNVQEEAKEERTIIVGKKLSLQCGDATITVEKNGNITVQGKKIMVKGDGPIEIEGKKLQVKSDGAVNVEASGKVVIKGSNVGVN
jgi:type VI secretion system secreted protein VgrG